MRKIKDLRKINTFTVGIYLRISVEDGRRELESNSIDNQRKFLKNYIKENDEFVLAKEYVDDGYTGTNFNRPGFQEMLQDALDGAINCVLVKDQSRLGRDHIATEQYVRRTFKDNGIRFVAVLDNYDSLYAGYDMMFSFRNLMNEYYAWDISNKCQAAFKAKQRSGEFVGAFASYGYRKSPRDKHVLEIDPCAADVVRRIFTMYLQGYGQLRIARVLNDEGVLCPSEYKKQNGENYRNAKKLDKTNYWTYSTVRKILQNEMYTGTMVQGKTRREMNGKDFWLDESEWIKVEDTHPAIVDKDAFETVKRLLKQKKVDLNFEENQSIFAGFLKCGECDRAMTKKNYKNAAGEKYFVFDCGSYVRSGSKVCQSKRIKESTLQAIVLEDLNQMITTITDLMSMVEQANDECLAMYDKTQIYEVEIEKLEKELKRTKLLKKRVFEEYAEETITPEEYVEYRNEYIKQEKQLNEKLENLMAKCQRENEVHVWELPWVKQLLDYKRIDKLTRDIIVEMIDTIYIYNDKRIKIRYNFSNEFEHLMKNVHSA